MVITEYEVSQWVHVQNETHIEPPPALCAKNGANCYPVFCILILSGLHVWRIKNEITQK
jgi:hypothetical protein